MMAIAAQAQQKSFYDFTVKTIDGEDISLSTFKGYKGAMSFPFTEILAIIGKVTP